MKALFFTASITLSIGAAAQVQDIQITATDSVVFNDGQEVNLYGEGSTLEGFHNIIQIEADYIQFNKETGDLYSSGVKSVISIGLTFVQEEPLNSWNTCYLYYNKGEDRVYITQKPKS